MIEDLAKNYEITKDKVAAICRKANRDPGEITIVGVSKTFPFSYVIELNKNGLIDFGENKIRELRDKYYNISFQYQGKINWHFVGHLQTNKVKDVVSFVHLIHSVDTFHLAEEIEKNAVKVRRVVDVLVQVNTSRESQKYGVDPDKAEVLCRQISLLENVRLRGIMTMAKLTEDTDEIRTSFRTAREIYDSLKGGIKNFNCLSMGMSNDYDIAIEEGANILRLGTSIFGERRIQV